MIKKMNKKHLLSFLLIVFVITLLLSSNFVNAQNLKNAKTYLTTAGTNIGYETDPLKASPEIFIGNIIKTTLGLIGILFLILIIIGGFQWMTAGGNEETITKAKQRIINSTIGLVVVLLAYAISYFIIYIITEQTLSSTAIES
jgi:Type IV secretion system pilin